MKIFITVVGASVLAVVILGFLVAGDESVVSGNQMDRENTAGVSGSDGRIANRNVHGEVGEKKLNHLPTDAGSKPILLAYSSKKVRDFCWLHRNNYELSRKEYAQLLAFVQATEIKPRELNSLLNCVIAQKEPPTDFYQLLLSIYDNELYSIRCRDYAVQFLQNAFVYTNTEGRQTIRERLIEIVKDGPEGHPGVAIRAYAGLIGQGFLDDNAQLFQLVKLLALNQAVSVSNRATALSVLADAPVLEGAALLRAIINADKDEDPTILRIAVRVLGDIGDAQDITAVTKFTNHENALLAKAAQASLARLNNR